jgi:hypothetical protein
MIMASFGRYLGASVHDYETSLAGRPRVVGAQLRAAPLEA